MINLVTYATHISALTVRRLEVQNQFHWAEVQVCALSSLHLEAPVTIFPKAPASECVLQTPWFTAPSSVIKASSTEVLLHLMLPPSTPSPPPPLSYGTYDDILGQCG